MNKTLVKTFNSASHGGEGNANFKMGVVTKTLKNGKNKMTPETLYRNTLLCGKQYCEERGYPGCGEHTPQLIGKLPWVLET